ncbi:MAG: tyrosine-type recombinase/integrase [Porticoccaceae bacterium]
MGSFTSRAVCQCIFDTGDLVKNGEDRLVVLNSVARAVVNRQRGKHREHVFTYTYKGEHKPVERMNTKAWRRARDVTELSQVRVHDLKHTFGRRLRAAGIGVETRMVMLGHTNKQITTHYSAVEIGELIEAAERVSFERGSTPTLTLLRSPNAETKGESRKSHAFGRNKKGLHVRNSLICIVAMGGLEPPTPAFMLGYAS